MFKNEKYFSFLKYLYASFLNMINLQILYPYFDL